MVIWCVLPHRSLWADFRKQSLFPQLLLFDEDQRVKDVVLEMMRFHKASAIIRYHDGRREFFGYMDAWTYRRLTRHSPPAVNPSPIGRWNCVLTACKFHLSLGPWGADSGYHAWIVEVWLVQSCRVHEEDLRSPGRVKSGKAWESEFS